MEIEFPLEFLIHGTPVSHQAKRARSREGWKAAVRAACAPKLPSPHFAASDDVSVTVYVFPALARTGAIDNSIKLILDACNAYVYVDDAQVQRIVIQKFEPGRPRPFATPKETLSAALQAEPPVVYIRISNDPFEELS